MSRAMGRLTAEELFSVGGSNRQYRSFVIENTETANETVMACLFRKDACVERSRSIKVLDINKISEKKLSRKRLDNKDANRNKWIMNEARKKRNVARCRV